MVFNSESEKKFLDSLVFDYKDQTPYSKAKKDVIHSLVESIITKPKSKKVLQLGCSGGYETKFLVRTFEEVHCIDGSKDFITKMKAKIGSKNLKFIYSLFEDYEFEESTYDYIFCNYILEHVYSPVDVLKNIRDSLKESGLIFAVVPNKNAFSRKLAKELGLVDNLGDLTENDHKHGHRRTYDAESISADFIEAGFTVLQIKGVIFKILADFQLNEMLSKSIIEEKHIFALQAMGEINIELCDSIFIVAKR